MKARGLNTVIFILGLISIPFLYLFIVGIFSLNIEAIWIYGSVFFFVVCIAQVVWVLKEFIRTYKK